MNAYSYSIEFNQKSEIICNQVYSYGHTKNISVDIGNNYAKADFTMTVLNDKESFDNMTFKLFNDLYFKVCFAHIFIFNKKFIINNIKIKITCNKSVILEHEINKDLVFFILDDNLNFQNFYSEELINMIFLNPKSALSTNQKICSLESYLFGCSKNYEIDKFTNYWTSMNSIYSYFSKLFSDKCTEYEIDIKKNLIPHKKDEPSMFIMLYLINKENRLPKNLTKFEDRNIIFDFEKCLKVIEDKEFKELYDYSEKGNILEFKNGLFSDYVEKYCDNVSFLGFIILLYPYYYRCMFLHGSLSLPIICSIYDFRLKSLKLMNYCLNRFLYNYIPILFSKKEFMNYNQVIEIKRLLEEREK